MKVYLASKSAIQSLRVLTRTESNTETSDLVRVWRAGGVLSRGMQDKFPGREFGVPKVARRVKIMDGFHLQIRCRTQEALSVVSASVKARVYAAERVSALICGQCLIPL